VELGHLTDFSRGCLASLASADFLAFGKNPPVTFGWDMAQ
jgi:hypothetical protein